MISFRFDIASHGSRGATLVIRLEPGAYTTQLISASGAAGEGMIEVYLLPQ